MAKWLQARKVESVAMESTGVYWIAPHEVLEAEGLEVMLVDTRQLAHVPGRDKKSDPFDCEWIQRLHSCGLLMGSFRPKEAVCLLRTLVRDKGNLVAEGGDWLRRMQKSLDQMNVRVHRAVSALDGVTGMAIVRANRRRRAGRAEAGETAGPPALPQSRQLGLLHTADFFLLRKNGAGWEECKTQETQDELVHLHSKTRTAIVSDDGTNPRSLLSRQLLT